MAADSPTPGTPPPCAACGYQHNPLGWCKANVCADCGLGQHAGPDHYDGCPAASSPVGTTEPPAETQQDDEQRRVGAADRATAREVVSAWITPGQSTSALDLDRLRAGIAAALAARPSADAETLREQVETWIDEAPEQTAGLDLLRQIIGRPR